MSSYRWNKNTMYGGRTVSLRYQQMSRTKNITTIKTASPWKQTCVRLIDCGPFSSFQGRSSSASSKCFINDCERPSQETGSTKTTQLLKQKERCTSGESNRRSSAHQPNHNVLPLGPKNRLATARVARINKKRKEKNLLFFFVFFTLVLIKHAKQPAAYILVVPYTGTRYAHKRSGWMSPTSPLNSARMAQSCTHTRAYIISRHESANSVPCFAGPKRSLVTVSE